MSCCASPLEVSLTDILAATVRVTRDETALSRGRGVGDRRPAADDSTLGRQGLVCFNKLAQLGKLAYEYN